MPLPPRRPDARRAALYGSVAPAAGHAAAGPQGMAARVLEFGEGCIYPLLHKLEQREYLASRKEVAVGRSRVVYRVTKKGQTSLAQSAAEWQRIARAITQVLHGGEHGRVAFT